MSLHKTSTAVLVSILLFGSGLVSVAQEETTKENSEEKTEKSKKKPTLVQGTNEFGYRLLTRIMDTDVWKKNNSSISGWSLASSMLMVQAAATDDLKTKINKVLGVDSLNQDQLLDRIEQRFNQLADAKSVTLKLGHAAVLKKQYKYDDSYADLLKNKFGAKLFSLDFQSEDAAKTINDWVRKKTNGKISNYEKRFHPEEIFHLINTVYFQGGWTTEFRNSKTEDEPFTLLDGSTKKVPMMAQDPGWEKVEGEDKAKKFDYEHRAYRGENFNAVRISYGDNRRFGLCVFVPHEDSSLRSFLSNMDAETLRKRLDKLNHEDKRDLDRVEIPKFSYRFKHPSLKKELSEMGLSDLFSPEAEKNKFPGMFQEEPNVPTWIGRVGQKSAITVNEEGTEAAVISSNVGRGGASLPNDRIDVVVADRPFFYVIQDRKTGIHLLTGTVVDPTLE